MQGKHCFIIKTQQREALLGQIKTFFTSYNINFEEPSQPRKSDPNQRTNVALNDSRERLNKLALITATGILSFRPATRTVSFWKKLHGDHFEVGLMHDLEWSFKVLYDNDSLINSWLEQPCQPWRLKLNHGFIQKPMKW